ncbi:MAG TPA: hypothetical protein VIU11_08850 [Nakamurella sp.]
MTTPAAHLTRPSPAATPALPDRRPDEPVGAPAHVVPVAGRVTPVPGPGDPARTIRRAPSDFGTSTATTLKSGWGPLGIGSTPWDAILAALCGVRRAAGRPVRPAWCDTMSRIASELAGWRPAMPGA